MHAQYLRKINIIEKYATYDDHYCLPDDVGHYNSYDDAESVCTKTLSCKMFFDNGGKGREYVLCGPLATKHISFSGSALYVKGN